MKKISIGYLIAACLLAVVPFASALQHNHGTNKNTARTFGPPGSGIPCPPCFHDQNGH